MPYLALNSRKHWWELQGNEVGEVEGRRKSTQDAFAIKLDLGGREGEGTRIENTLQSYP